MCNNPNEPFYILSIDGGGYRGVYPASLVKLIEEKYEINWKRKFGLITGTSTGSIIAAGIASGISTNVILKMYEEYGPFIFKKNVFPRFGVFWSRYKKNNLSKALNEIFGDKKLGDVETPLIIPATDIGNGGVHVFKSTFHEDFIRDEKVLVREAILASCSAPAYFNPHRVDKYLLSDGGLWANCPALVATIDAKHRLEIELDQIKVLSIGTGISKQFYPLSNKKIRWGMARGWGVVKFISMLLNLQAETSNNMLNLLLKPEQVLRVNFESDKELPLDDPQMHDDLVGRADKDFTHKHTEIQKFLELKRKD